MIRLIIDVPLPLAASRPFISCKHIQKVSCNTQIRWKLVREADSDVLASHLAHSHRKVADRLQQQAAGTWAKQAALIKGWKVALAIWQRGLHKNCERQLMLINEQIHSRSRQTYPLNLPNFDLLFALILDVSLVTHSAWKGFYSFWSFCLALQASGGTSGKSHRIVWWI